MSDESAAAAAPAVDEGAGSSRRRLPRRPTRPGRRGWIAIAVAVLVVAGGLATGLSLADSHGHGDRVHSESRADQGDHGSSGNGAVQQIIGTVSALGTNTLSVASVNSTKTFAITSDTSVIASGGSAALSGLKSGEAVVVVADLATTSGGNPLAQAVYAGILPTSNGQRHGHHKNGND